MTKPMTEARRAAVIDIFLTFETAGADHFSAELIRLFMKADGRNFQKLENEWPVLAGMIREWRDTPTAAEFYDKYGVK